MNELRKATKQMFERYLTLIENNGDEDCSPDGRIASMCRTAIDNIENYPIDKLNRWLGFIQGVMWTWGVIDLDEERNFSRPLFHKAYKEMNIEVPKTYDYSKESSRKDQTSY